MEEAGVGLDEWDEVYDFEGDSGRRGKCLLGHDEGGWFGLLLRIIRSSGIEETRILRAS